MIFQNILKLFLRKKPLETPRPNIPVTVIGDPIIETNLLRMTGKSTFDMPSTIMQKTMRGNAGRWERFPCTFVDFTYWPENGRIISFGNSEPIMGVLGEYRIAMNYESSSRNYRIVETIANPRDREALETLQRSAEIYNDFYGFNNAPETTTMRRN